MTRHADEVRQIIQAEERAEIAAQMARLCSPASIRCLQALTAADLTMKQIVEITCYDGREVARGITALEEDEFVAAIDPADDDGEVFYRADREAIAVAIEVFCHTIGLYCEVSRDPAKWVADKYGRDRCATCGHPWDSHSLTCPREEFNPLRKGEAVRPCP